MAEVERLLSYRATADLLVAYDLPLAPGRLVDSAPEAEMAAAALGFPVALKAISPDLSHKSDAGLVRLNLQGGEEVRSAAESLLLAAAGPKLEGLLVQQMIPAGVEMIVGLSRDRQFGPVIALGSGGVLVELLDDVALRLPPLTSRQAEAMIRETRSWRLLQGYRGGRPGDVTGLARLLVNLSRLALEQGDRIASLDLNPVIVLPDGVWAVDVRCVMRKT